jgi:hypothetical protein
MTPKICRDDGHQHINLDDDPDPNLDNIVAHALEGLDSKMPHDPFEE